jgi:hypothetical protein
MTLLYEVCTNAVLLWRSSKCCNSTETATPFATPTFEWDRTAFSLAHSCPEVNWPLPLLCEYVSLEYTEFQVKYKKNV